VSTEIDFAKVMARAIDPVLFSDDGDPGAVKDFPHMPLGECVDMGTAADGTPVIDPRIFFSTEFRRNPWPYYRLLRDHHPVYFNKLNNTYYVTRYDDMTECYYDDIAFNTIPKGSSNGVLGNVTHELSGIEHRRRRNLFGQHLVGKSLENRIPAIERLAREMIDDFDNLDSSIKQDKDGVRTIELGRAFAYEFPVRVVCDVLGFPTEAREHFFYWYDSIMGGLGASETHKQGMEARQHLQDYIADMVEERRRDPTYLHDNEGNKMGKDIISKLCESQVDGDYLSSEEITALIALVVAGGGETTRGTIMNMWYSLLQHTDQFQAVVADENLWDAAFHETLRHSNPIGGQPRHNTFDVEIHGIVIPAGSLIEMVNFSGSHDERIFKNPDTFDIFRDDLYSGKLLRSGYNKDGKCSHMAFGVGPHMCPGAWISQQEAVIGAKILAGRLKNARINVDRMPKDTDSVDLAPIGINKLRDLWIDYDLD
jgi:cytochrome P450